MTLRHIRIFLAVCTSDCNATRAAEQLHMSQPAVSLALRELEEHYGTLLFDRIGRRLHLTQAGERLREYAQHIEGLFEDMERTLSDWNRSGPLQIGASLTIGGQFLPWYCRTFSARHPGTRLQVVVAASNRLEQRLLEGSLDFALMEGIPRSPLLRAEEYMEDHLAVICAPGAFAPDQELTLAEFEAQDLLLREAGSGTREEVDRILAQAGVCVQPLWESMSNTALVNAAAGGLGLAVLPYRTVVEAVQQGKVVCLHVAGLDFRRHFRIAWHRDKYITPLAREFMAFCKEDAAKKIGSAWACDF